MGAQCEARATAAEGAVIQATTVYCWAGAHLQLLPVVNVLKKQALRTFYIPLHT
jgi:hypothetical protein